ncbi:MAG: class I SAM-dependent methyltransferase [Candidatus Accumulibacter sp.]|uniref:class I SAM-dependent methyltransferase n=1 Tax=Accumulibacter sp. TaxID=2053492 RepID=UPI001DC4ABCE|nr:class I SAM-dependent methyltransferase [Accumulibacter sp.]MCB1941156.1 class I SAM-dependent methyltransferase [Accumulibacter sp.]
MINEGALRITASSDESLPAAWVRRFAGLIPAHGEVLDLACGSGRHARFLAGLGYAVEAVDRNPQALAALHGVSRVSPRQADLEVDPWPFAGRSFAGIVVTNYLYRARLDELLACLANPGVLIYETFMVGNERFGKPSNPDFLLRPQEMLGWLQGRDWRVVAFEEGEVDVPRPAVVQRLCAARGALVGRL